MYGRVAAGTPTGAVTEISRMVFLPDKNLPRRPLHLRVTFQAKIIVALDEHLGVDRTVGAVTHGASLAQRLVLEHKRLRLVTMTIRTCLVQTPQTQAAGGFHHVRAVRVMALHAIHLPLEHGMMLWQAEFGVGVEMAIEARGRVPAGIENKLPAPAADFGMFATGAVTSFTAAWPNLGHRREMHPRVSTGRELPDVIGVALQTVLVADVIRAGNIRRHNDRTRHRGTGIRHQQNRQP